MILPSYARSVKSPASDELINTYLIRPLAGLLVEPLTNTGVTPNHLTIGSILFGIIAACLFLQGTHAFTAAAGAALFIKDLLDSADGQLARATGQFSRKGRFLDSIGDFIVNLLVFSLIGVVLAQSHADVLYIFLALAGFLGTTLRVSYHVYYQTSYLHLHGKYDTNRIVEEVSDEGREAEMWIAALHRAYLFLYGWQDRLMVRIDLRCRKGVGDLTAWFSDHTALRLSGFMGLGTELFLLAVCSWANRLELYMWINLLGMNALWLGTLWYRRAALRRRLAD